MAGFPYVFSSRRQIAQEYPRVLRLISHRLTRLGKSPGADPLHEIRTLIKLLRALLWLAQPNLPPAAVASAKKHFQSAARSLSGAREHAVLRSTLKNLAAESSDAAPVRHLTEKIARSNGHLPAKLLHQAEAEVKKTITQLERDVTVQQNWKSPAKRLKKSLKQVAKARAAAQKKKADPAFHEWRKKTKRLLYLLQVLAPRLSRKKRRLIPRIDQIQHQLGDAQDSVILQATLKKKLKRTDPTLKPVLHQLDKRKKKLRKKAVKLSCRGGL